jgi:glycosyltransferase involved in cell wall biosynthesis
MIKVGITEAHGMAVESSQHPPPGVEYSFLTPSRSNFRFIRSPIKGYYQSYEADRSDLIEAIMSPVKAGQRWILSCANLQEAVAFSFLGAPLPRRWRIAHIKRLFAADNFKKLVFWSEAGRRTLHTYGRIEDAAILAKATVVYPAVRRVPDDRIRVRDSTVTTLLFSGDFFRKGGVNVVDAFERVQRSHPAARLVLCCDESLDFNTPNTALRSEYLSKIRENAGIQWLGRIRRDRLLSEVLPQTDIYLLPTYNETFGMAVLEAMAFGIPVIATNYFAIPEMLEDEVSGLLIDTSAWDCDQLFRGYVVDRIPPDFREHVTEQLVHRIERLVESVALRKAIGLAALEVARTKFSFETRNSRMLAIYREATEE